MRFTLLPTCLAVLFLSACLSSAGEPGVRLASNMPDEALAEVFARVQSSVVTIRTVNLGAVPGGGEVVTDAGIGSGVLVSDDGKILTASHVVQTADLVQVEFVDGTARQARVLGSVPTVDVALLQLIGSLPRGVHVAEVGTARSARVGSDVFVVGAPLGVTHTLTVGHVSALRLVACGPCEPLTSDIIQTDAAINPGNSGGPMFDMSGRVIGIVSYIVSSTGGGDGLGFAVGADTAKRLLIDRDVFWSGLDYVKLSGQMAAAFQVPGGGEGLLVQRVAKDSPGARLGIRGGSIPAVVAKEPLLLGGDVILEVFGMPVHHEGIQEAIIEARSRMDPDAPVRVVVLRAGERVVLERPLRELIAN